MGRTGIMGGTFNPIHNGHLVIANYALEEFQLDRVLFLTSGTPPHKRGNPVPPGIVRAALVEKAIAGNPAFSRCDYEISRTQYSYTAETLAYLGEAYPGEELYFIIGGDSLKTLPDWYQPARILDSCVLLVYPRDGLELDELIPETIKQFGGDIRQIHAPALEISSSMIRRRIREGKSVRYLVPEAVYQELERSGLYRKGREQR